MSPVGTLLALGLVATPVAHKDFSVYESKQHNILINWPRHLMSIWPSGIALHFTKRSMAYQPRNMRDWDDHGVCGVETPVWTFVVPAAGLRRATYGGRRFVSGVAAGKPEVSVYDDKRGHIYSFSYNRTAGIDRITIGGGRLGRPERFILTRGVGLLRDCIARSSPPLSGLKGEHRED